MNERQLLNTEEAAEFLGMTAITLRKARCNGKVRAHIPPVPYIQLGRTIRYDVGDLHDYIAKHRKEHNSHFEIPAGPVTTR